MPSKPAFSRRCRCPSRPGGHVDSNALAIYLGKLLICHKLSGKARLNSGRKSVGLFPEHTEVTRARSGPPIPAIVVEELTRLKALYQGFGYRELARILHYPCNEHIDDKTVKKLWHQLPLPSQGA